MEVIFVIFRECFPKLFFKIFQNCSKNCGGGNVLLGRNIFIVHSYQKIKVWHTKIPSMFVSSMFVLSKWLFWNLFGAPDVLTGLGARTFLLIFVLWSKKVGNQKKSARTDNNAPSKVVWCLLVPDGDELRWIILELKIYRIHAVHVFL